MKKIFFSIIVALLVLLNSCDNNLSTNNHSLKNAEPEMVCKPIYYRKIQGKTLGIWLNYRPEWWSVSCLYDLRVRYGFSNIHVYYERRSNDEPNCQFNRAKMAGYQNNEILYSIIPHYLPRGKTLYEFLEYVDSLGITNYYMDEPIEANWDTTNTSRWPAALPKDSVRWVADTLYELNPNARLFISSYTPAEWVVPRESTTYEFAKEYWEILMNCRHNNVYMMNDAYEESAQDQGDDWEQFFYFYYINWQRRSISDFTNDDQDFREWDYLLNKANQIGLHNIWLYNADVASWTRLKLFCDAAARQGWLVKKYEPPHNSPCDNCK